MSGLRLVLRRLWLNFLQTANFRPVWVNRWGLWVAADPFLRGGKFVQWVAMNRDEGPKLCLMGGHQWMSDLGSYDWIRVN